MIYWNTLDEGILLDRLYLYAIINITDRLILTCNTETLKLLQSE